MAARKPVRTRKVSMAGSDAFIGATVQGCELKYAYTCALAAGLRGLRVPSLTRYGLPDHCLCTTPSTFLTFLTPTKELAAMSSAFV